MRKEVTVRTSEEAKPKTRAVKDFECIRNPYFKRCPIP